MQLLVPTGLCKHDARKEIKFPQIHNVEVNAMNKRTLSALLLIATLGHNAAAESIALLREGDLAIDIINKLEWQRCSFGQTFQEQDGKANCEGDIIPLSVEQAQKIAEKMSEERQSNPWRLPTKDELEGLVRKDQGSPTINRLVFPNTFNGPYWTGQANFWNKENYWTVSFHTGNSYGRFFPNQEMAVRFVRDRIRR